MKDCYKNFVLLLVLDDVELLVLTERIETLVPLTYIAVMSLAYYGPNAEIVGSVKLQIWHHRNVIEDFEVFAMNIAILFAMDFLSFIINGWLLWKYCNINVWLILSNIQQRYCLTMAYLEVDMLGGVRFSSIISLKL